VKAKACCWLLILIIVLTGLSVLSCGDNAQIITLTAGDGTMIEFKDTGVKPPLLVDTSKKYIATIETEKGNLVLELFARDVPKAVSNFVYLALQGYYDNCTFHRVIPDFMAQGGDPTGTGMGGPGYTFANEITGHTHIAGALSMANTGQPDSNGSQFFICYTAQHSLDGSYSVFGQLIEGMDVLQNLTPRNPNENPQFLGDRIIKVTIKVEKP
jgi:cyclophilin family peptidyl-prolyl cis-trans isomerase